MDSILSKALTQTTVLSPPTPGESSGRMRVLIVVAVCNPYSGSEAGCGWKRVRETAKHCDVWAICGEGGESVRRWLSENGDIPSLQFRFLPPTAPERTLLRTTGMLYVGYNLWQRRAYRIARALHEKIGFDIVHQATLSSYREPGYLWKLGVPFVWGPVGGLENYPWRFLPSAGMTGGWFEGARGVANFLQSRFDGRVRKAARRAAAVFTVNDRGREHFRNYYGVETIPMLDLGTSGIATQPPPRGGRKGPLRILWISSFLHCKAFHLLVEALRGLPGEFPYELRVCGGGPLEKRWRRKATSAGIDARCRWMGWIDPAEVMRQYDWADVLVFTSLRDACGSVVPEALDHGLPVICLDSNGASDVLTTACGIKVPATTPRETIKGIRDAIVAVEGNRDTLDTWSAGAVGRARLFDWPRKIEETVRVYRDVLPGNRHGNAGRSPGREPYDELHG